MNQRIGILGGMGSGATLHLLQLLMRSLARDSKSVADQNYPDMTILMENLAADKSPDIINADAGPSRRINRSIAGLILSGCDPIIVSSISAHGLVEQRWFDAGVIDFRRCLIDHFDSLYTGKIAILASDRAIGSDLFAPLNDSFEFVYPDEKLQKDIMSIINDPHGLRANDTDIASCRNKLDRVIKDLRYHDVDYYLAGCSEIETFVSDQKMEDFFILPMAAMCKEVVERVQRGVVNE